MQQTKMQLFATFGLRNLPKAATQRSAGVLLQLLLFCKLKQLALSVIYSLAINLK